MPPRAALGKGGAVVYVGAPEQALGSDHAAAAGALGTWTKTLGVEWARDGIRVNAVLTCETDATCWAICRLSGQRLCGLCANRCRDGSGA